MQLRTFPKFCIIYNLQNTTKSDHLCNFMNKGVIHFLVLWKYIVNILQKSSPTLEGIKGKCNFYFSASFSEQNFNHPTNSTEKSKKVRQNTIITLRPHSIDFRVRGLGLRVKTKLPHTFYNTYTDLYVKSFIRPAPRPTFYYIFIHIRFCF